MKKVALLVILSFVVGVPVAWRGHAQGDVVLASLDNAVPSGTYAPFDTWQKIRYGATVLMNPKAAQGAAVVYGYEADKIVKELSSAELAKIQAKLANGKVQYGDITPIGLAVAGIRFSARIASELGKCKEKCSPNICPEKCTPNLNGKFLSKEPSVAGLHPSGAWIVWEPNLEESAVSTK